MLTQNRRHEVKTFVLNEYSEHDRSAGRLVTCSAALLAARGIKVAVVAVQR
jgi:hypothetical protein